MAEHDCIETAVRFMAAQPGAVERVLGAHRPDANGRCTGCLTTPVNWPCTVAGIATRAAALLALPLRR